MKRIGRLLTAAALTLGLTGMLAPAMALAADTPQSTVCQTLTNTKDCSKTPADTVTVSSALSTGISIFSVIIGVVAVIMIMVGGFRYITAGGDSSKITSAKNTLIYAIVGLVIAALAQLLVKFVLHNVATAAK